MSWIEAVILGVIQGLTEFLPISSSGHLVLVQYLLKIDNAGVLLEIVLHLGTLLSILFYYYKDLKKLIINAYYGKKEYRDYIGYLFIATIPAVCTGLYLNEMIELAFNISFVQWMFMVSGLVLGSTYFFRNRSKTNIGWFIACCIGLAQSLALFPGISRSGVTISIAIIMGVKNKEAAKFSFYMAIPILIGAGILQMLTIESLSNISLMPLFIGFLSAAFSGYLVMCWLIGVISKGKFYLFSIYCIIISILLLLN